MVSQRWPVFLPDGRHFLYHQMGGRAESRGIYVGALDTSPPTRLLADDSSAVYARGYLLFGRANSLVAQPFDPRHLRVSGDPVVVARGAGRLVSMYMPATVSDNGRLIYEAYDRRSRFVWFDRHGQQVGAIGDAARQGDPVATPDGFEVLSWKGDEAAVDLWLDDVRRGTSSRVTFSGLDVLPIWSPDADETIFRSSRSGPGDLYRKSLRRTAPEVLLLKSAARKDPTDWSLDGRYLLYDNYDFGEGNKTSDIWVLPLFGEGTPTRYAASPFSKWAGRFSPDLRWVAYDADDTGKPEVYVQAFPATNDRWRVSTSGGDEPHWRRDGRELFYLAPDGWLTAVSVSRRGASLDFGAPQRLFQIARKYTVLRNLFAVSADGAHFLVDTPIQDAAAVPLTVVLNWPAGLPK
jgi:Tol biopolymer transport system component